MKNNQEKILIFLALLPTILFPISIPLSFILAAALLVYSINTIQDQQALKKVLTPLTLFLLIGVSVGTINIFFSTIHGFGELFNSYDFSTFKYVLMVIQSIFNFVLSTTLYAFSALILLSFAKDKPVLILSGIVDKIMKNDFNFIKKKTKDQQKEKEDNKE